MRIAVIGAGVVGALIARELARYETEVLVFEQEPEPGFGVTKANSAIVHAGFHEEPGTLRARFCVQGNIIFPEVCAELSVPFRRIGALVLAFSSDEESILLRLQEWGEINGVSSLAILSREEILAREPHVNPLVRKALWSPSVGITEPWALAQAAAENALENGAEFHFEEPVQGIIVRHRRIQAIKTTKAVYTINAVVNAAGLYADKVAFMVGASFPSIVPRRGQYILLDKAVDGLVSSVLFPTPTPISKGILVVPTVTGGILLGPTAEDLNSNERKTCSTTREGLAQVISGAQKLVPSLPLNQVIKTFAGLRPEPSSGDFVVGPASVKGMYHAGGMRSPGLTAAPAVARFLVHEVIASEMGLHKKGSFNPIRHPIPRVEEFDEKEWEARIQKDPRWGRVVCFCNVVTEAQIVEAIRRGARTLDGVKFRTHAGFGCCQGSFCTVKILEILARELNISIEALTVCGKGSHYVYGRVRP